MFKEGDKFQGNRWKKNCLEASKQVILIFSLLISDLVCRYNTVNTVLVLLFLTSFVFFFSNPTLYFLCLCSSVFTTAFRL